MSLQHPTTYPNTRQLSVMAGASVVATLLPIVAAVFVAYLVIGLVMPVIPLHVHQGLGLGTLVVGLVAGCQFTASLITAIRRW